jgi:hypothetical protein
LSGQLLLSVRRVRGCVKLTAQTHCRYGPCDNDVPLVEFVDNSNSLSLYPFTVSYCLTTKSCYCVTAYPAKPRNTYAISIILPRQREEGSLPLHVLKLRVNSLPTHAHPYSQNCTHSRALTKLPFKYNTELLDPTILHSSSIARKVSSKSRSHETLPLRQHPLAGLQYDDYDFGLESPPTIAELLHPICPGTRTNRAHQCTCIN